VLSVNDTRCFEQHLTITAKQEYVRNIIMLNILKFIILLFGIMTLKQNRIIAVCTGEASSLNKNPLVRFVRLHDGGHIHSPKHAVECV